MAISKKVQEALNDQINAELFSEYLYLAMSAFLEESNLGGMAKWMRIQSGEERKHAMKIYDHIHERLGEVSLGAIEKPRAGWKSARAAFEDALKHERYISSRIHDLLALARRENDAAVENLMRWFVDEQVEEERQADEIVRKFEMIGDDPRGLYLLDKELGAREA